MAAPVEVAPLKPVALLDPREWVRQPLQRGAPENIRRHLRRAVVRTTVLVVADMAAFYILRGFIRLLGSIAAGPDSLLGQVTSLFPGRYFNGWQFAIGLMIGLLVTGNYGQGDRRRDPARLLAGASLATALPLWDAIWHAPLSGVLLPYFVTTGVIWAVLTVDRWAVEIGIVQAWRGRPVAARAVEVTCGADCATWQHERFADSGSTDFRSVGRVDVTVHDGPNASVHRLPRLLAEKRAETVVVCDHLSQDDIQFVADAAMTAGCQMFVIPHVFGIAGVQPRVHWRRGEPIVELTAPTMMAQQLLLKRVIDLVGAAVGLVVLSPLMAVIAVVVRFDSKGAVVFSQERVGQGGRIFRILKFRTMVANAESLREELAGRSLYSDQRLFKVPSDPRVTRIGKFLRRSSLDELPQLWNVLVGEMSLVGPRPPLPSEVAFYEAHHHVRFDVKPGITGPWQVAGRNKITDFEKVIALETAYIREWSLWSDLVILAQTFRVVLKMQGAH